MPTDDAAQLISSAYTELATGLRELAAHCLPAAEPAPDAPVEDHGWSARSNVVVPFARGFWEGLWVSTVGLCGPLVVLDVVAGPLRNRL